MDKEIIDISSYQGVVDFDKIKEQVCGVIIRCGYTGYGKSKQKVQDIYFEKNYEAAKKVELPLGVYYYSCATSINEAHLEAKFVLDLIKDKKIELGVWFDTEDNHDINLYAPQSQASIGKLALTNVANHFLNSVNDAGYKTGIYASTNWLNNQLDMDQLIQCRVWVAQYADSYTYRGKVDLWQYTDKGTINGINGNVDKSKVINEELIKEEGMNDQYFKTTYNGLVVHVAKVGKQEEYEYQGSVTGNRYGTSNAAQRSIYMEDPELEKEGWKSFVNVNGSLFYTYGNTTYAEGIEKCCGIAHQDWDTEFDLIPAIGFKKDGSMRIDTQYYIRTHLNEFYGAVTSVFGVLKKGVAYGRPSKHTSQYDSISGRTLIGQNALGQIVIASFSGVTGKSGLRGSQLPDLAQYLGMTECVCMDGGGSVYFSSEGSIKLNTTRAVKNDVIMYRREKKNMEILPEESNPESESKTSGMVICTADKKLNIREQPVSGKVLVTVGKNEFIEILDFLDGLKSDGYQWAKVRWNGIEGYSQIDTAYTALKEKSEL